MPPPNSADHGNHDRDKGEEDAASARHRQNGWPMENANVRRFQNFAPKCGT
jgi:hypothetical protein